MLGSIDFIPGNIATGQKTLPVKGPRDPRTIKTGNSNLLVNLFYSHNNILDSTLRLNGYYQDYENVFSLAGSSTGLPAGGSPLIYAQKYGARLDIHTPVPIGEDSSVLWGVDYVDDRTGQDLVNLLLPEPFTRRVNAPKVRQKSLAGFIQGTITPVDWLTLRGGVRYEDIKVSWDPFNVIANGTSTSPLPGIAIPGASPSYSATTFNFGANFKVTNWADIYAAFSEGCSVAEVGSGPVNVCELYSCGGDMPGLW